MQKTIFYGSVVALLAIAASFLAQERSRYPGGPMRGRTTPSFTSSPLPQDDEEKQILAVLDEMSRRGGEYQSVPTEDGRLLRLLAEAINAKHVVELGTSQGYSAIWFCLALRKTGGKLTTYEIDADRIAEARLNFQRAGVGSLVTIVQGDAHVEVTKQKEPIDLLFIDADKEGYLDYLNKLLPLVRPGGVIVAHNMNAAQADPRFVEAITTNAQLETLFVNGMGITLKKR